MAAAMAEDYSPPTSPVVKRKHKDGTSSKTKQHHAAPASPKRSKKDTTGTGEHTTTTPKGAKNGTAKPNGGGISSSTPLTSEAAVKGAESGPVPGISKSGFAMQTPEEAAEFASRMTAPFVQEEQEKTLELTLRKLRVNKEKPDYFGNVKMRLASDKKGKLSLEFVMGDGTVQQKPKIVGPPMLDGIYATYAMTGNYLEKVPGKDKEVFKMDNATHSFTAINNWRDPDMPAEILAEQKAFCDWLDEFQTLVYWPVLEEKDRNDDSITEDKKRTVEKMHASAADKSATTAQYAVRDRGTDFPKVPMKKKVFAPHSINTIPVFLQNKTIEQVRKEAIKESNASFEYPYANPWFFGMQDTEGNKIASVFVRAKREALEQSIPKEDEPLDPTAKVFVFEENTLVDMPNKKLVAHTGRVAVEANARVDNGIQHMMIPVFRPYIANSNLPVELIAEYLVGRYRTTKSESGGGCGRNLCDDD